MDRSRDSVRNVMARGHQLGWRPVSGPKYVLGRMEIMDFNGNEAWEFKSMEIHGNQLISIEMHVPGPESLAPCGNLWRAVISCGGPFDAPRKPLQAGRPQIIRPSDVGIIGWSGLGDQQWSDLRSSAV